MAFLDRFTVLTYRGVGLQDPPLPIPSDFAMTECARNEECVQLGFLELGKNNCKVELRSRLPFVQ